MTPDEADEVQAMEAKAVRDRCLAWLDRGAAGVVRAGVRGLRAHEEVTMDCAALRRFLKGPRRNRSDEAWEDASRHITACLGCQWFFEEHVLWLHPFRRSEYDLHNVQEPFRLEERS